AMDVELEDEREPHDQRALGLRGCENDLVIGLEIEHPGGVAPLTNGRGQITDAEIALILEANEEYRTRPVVASAVLTTAAREKRIQPIQRNAGMHSPPRTAAASGSKPYFTAADRPSSSLPWAACTALSYSSCRR